jgi:hypothetical protein
MRCCNKTVRSIRPVVSFTTLLALAALALAIAAPVSAQTNSKGAESSTSTQQFVGTWRAELKGRPYFILTIESVTPKVVGKFVAAPGLNVSPNGEVTNIWSDAKLSDAHSLIEPKLDGNRLSFQYKFEAGDEYADTFEMVLNTPDEATLRLTKTFDNQEQRFISEEEIAKAMKPSHLKKAEDPVKK